ncbi:HNH endonuclease [Candidatus Termititenax aidoneus]|uniref:HNH endonuclease n=1 Tax=Termititenax aidoneus TaxID=2218524 RepID=A0A388TGD6_TERA1|nr:HNH endonuclease [Candidatus Termititenax aidoneus]
MSRPHIYTPEQIQFLKRNIQGRSYSDLHRLFNEHFGLDFAFNKIIRKIKYLGLHNGRRNLYRCYSSEEIQFLKENFAEHTYAELTKLFNERFGATKSKLTVIRLCVYSDLSKHKIFARNCPIGHERIDSDGYTKVKIAYPNIWRHKHLIIWEREHGKMPKYHFVLFADKNKLNFALDNLLLVSSREISIMNRYGLIFQDAEKTKIGLLIAKLKLAIVDKEREARGNQKWHT